MHLKSADARSSVSDRGTASKGTAASQNAGSAKQTALFLLFASFIFLVLYRRFLFGSAVYLYSDIGSDSVASSYPILVMLSRLFQAGDFSFYTLSSGLGADTTATFLQYVNPLKAFLLLFNRDTMPVGLLLQLYLGTLLTAWAAWRYLLLITRHSFASMAGGLLFAYSSYAVLWSQNLTYGICAAMFALTMLALEAFLRSRTLLRFLALTGVLALYLFTNYFFSYMTAVFVIAYIPLRAVFLRGTSHENGFLKGFLLTGLSALCAAVMSAAAVAAITGTFLGSVRTGDASRSLSSLLKRGIDPRMAAAWIGRLFSENMLGIGDEYRGPDNYYEIAALSIGALFFFAFFYMLFQKKLRAKLLIVSALVFFALSVPVLRYLLNINWLVMRFSFWISLLMCIAAALFLKEVMTDFDPGALLWSVICTLITSGVLIGILRFLSGRLEIGLSLRTVLFCGVFLAAYAAALLVIRKKLLPAKMVPCLLFLLIFAEIVIVHHDTLYLRLYITKEQFGNSVYSPVTDEAIRDLEKSDRDVYRVASTEDPFYANEGLVDGFNATTLYNNTNPAALRTLALAYGTNEVSTPYFLSGYPEYYQFTSLAGRYLIRTETAGAPVTEPALFDRIAAYPTADPAKEKVVYKNRNALPFGYLLTNEISEKEFMDSGLVTRMELLTDSWFETGSSEAADAEANAQADAEADTEANAEANAEADTEANTEADAEANTEADAEAEAADADRDRDAKAEAGSESHADAASADTVADLTKSARWVNPHNLIMEETRSGIRFTADGDDPYIFVFLDTSKETADTSNYIHMKVRAKNKNTMQNITLYYLGSEDSDPTEEWINTIFYNKYYPESLTLLPDGIAGFRFDIDDDIESVTLSELELVTCSDPYGHFDEPKSTDIRNISFRHDLYEADVTSEQQDSVLCVPLLYGKGWSAEVNGAPAEVMNINGGLCGIRLKAGGSHVEIRYSVPHFKAALIVTLAACAVYLAAHVFALTRSRKHR